MAVLCVAILGSATFLFADSVWTGDGATNNWSDPANWSTNMVPLPADSVIFDGATSKESHIDAGFGGTIASITINGYAGSIYQERSLVITGDYSQSSGTFVAPPNLSFSVENSFSVSASAPAGFFRFTGSGVASNPILVYDVYGLQCMKNGSAFYFRLNDNIDASVTAKWRRGPGLDGFAPVGGTLGGGSFQHLLDGDGHTISNLYINITDTTQTYVGLLGYNMITVRNLGLVNCSITGPGPGAGSSPTFTGSIAGMNMGTISNCYNTGAVSSQSCAAGLAGRNQGSVSNSYNSGNISGSVAGGLTTDNTETGKISNCYNVGNVSSNTSLGNAGGLVGGANSGTVEYCHNAGNVTAGGTESGNRGGYAGGLVLWNYSIISNCYNTGAVAQINSNGNDGFAGGLVGWQQGTIKNSYNTGSVSGGHIPQSGGLVGFARSGKIYNSYNIGTVVGGGALVGDKAFGIEPASNCGYWTGAVGGPGACTAQYPEADRNAFTNPLHGVYTRTDLNTYNPWDFTNVWDMYTGSAGSSFPFFRWQVPSSAWTLNMTEMNWYQNAAPYNSTGAAVCQMILGYIREAVVPAPAVLTQNEIYEYGKSPAAYGPEMTPSEVDKALGHFDPYDSIVSNWSDSYDLLPDGNPYQGYNYTVDTYDPRVDADAINKYMRDICHWMAYTVTKEFWWMGGDLVAKPNTPAAIPIYGSYANWVAVKGCATSANPCPEPQTNPFNTPDFKVYGFWIKDPKINGIGQNTFKTAAECQATYFLPMATGDAYDGLFLQVAEPPSEMSQAAVEIPQPAADPANLVFIGVQPTAIEPVSDGGQLMAMSSLSPAPMKAAQKVATPVKKIKPLVKKQSWRDLVDKNLLSDPEAVAAFEGTKIGKSIFVERTDPGADYYLAPFYKRVKGKMLVSAVMILDSAEGYFREASWTDKPIAGELLKVDANDALRLVRNIITKDYLAQMRALPRTPAKTYVLRQRDLMRKYIGILRNMRYVNTALIWEPNGYSSSPYKPYWKIELDGQIWFVTQEMKVITK
jgi:hypothetical protein